MEEQHDLLANDLYVTESIQENFLISSKWGKFLSIVGFISCGLLVIGGIYLATNSSLGQLSRFGATAPTLGLTYIIMAGLLFFPCLYLFKFSAKVKEAVVNTRQDSFESSIESLKAMFKFYGILTIIILGFYLIIILVLMVGVAGR